ncbi:ABC transporter ATP-binding protein [Reinekea marinisedimentorum]|uniref:Osmoprotectant transport system ATP-binding protein n=1 Tax=Reinekea marinisedimentorum TaxID=230495 RepID=A0A4R3HX01_9GAMM|nr:ABC transporter ATP-binding protein [Reinekea marinisedimentorum]TCS36685.1 osmoprotectant transport system ATP-binding protein [Reinekea marinisedimentorum]
MIEFQNVSKSYHGKAVIENLSLHLEKGKITVIIGSSGSGKSTTLKMINRLEEHNAGKILFAGEEIASIPVEQLRCRMGYAIQSNGLFPHWSVAENIACVPNLLKWDKQKIARRVDELLEVLDLSPEQYRDRMPHQLSGGQQQRVGVARAMAADPEILLMDEPFGALDPVTRASMQKEVRRIHRLYGKTILVITHDIDEALYLADHLILMDKGAIVQQGAPMEILTQPANDFVRDFIGRSDIGLKMLSLQTVESHMVPGEYRAGCGVISSDIALNEALSRFISEQSDVLNVTGADDVHLGLVTFSGLLKIPALQSQMGRGA